MTRAIERTNERYATRRDERDLPLAGASVARVTRPTVAPGLGTVAAVFVAEVDDAAVAESTTDASRVTLETIPRFVFVARRTDSRFESRTPCVRV